MFESGIHRNWFLSIIVLSSHFIILILSNTNSTVIFVCCMLKCMLSIVYHYQVSLKSYWATFPVFLLCIRFLLLSHVSCLSVVYQVSITQPCSPVFLLCIRFLLLLVLQSHARCLLCVRFLLLSHVPHFSVVYQVSLAEPCSPSFCCVSGSS